MKKLFWFACKFVALMGIGIVLYHRVYPFYLTYIVPYLISLLSPNSSGQLQQSQVDAVYTFLGISVLLGSWTIALFKIVLGSYPKLSEDDVQIFCATQARLMIFQIYYVPQLMIKLQGNK